MTDTIIRELKQANDTLDAIHETLELGGAKQSYALAHALRLTPAQVAKRVPLEHITCLHCDEPIAPGDDYVHGKFYGFSHPSCHLAHLAANGEETIPLSYLVKQTQRKLVSELTWWFRNEISSAIDGAIRDDYWSKGWMIFYIKGNPNGDISVRFTSVVWDPTLTKEVRGPDQLLDDVDKTYHGAGFLAELRNSTEDLAYKDSQTVSSEHSRTVTMAQEVSLDIGSKSTVSVGGETTGAKAEEELSVNLGLKLDTSQEEAESQSKSETKDIDEIFPKAHDTLMMITTKQAQTQRNLSINGVLDPGMDVVWPGRMSVTSGEGAWDIRLITAENTNAGGLVDKTNGNPNDMSGNYEIAFPNWQEFLDMIGGHNVRFPSYGAPDRSLPNITDTTPGHYFATKPKGQVVANLKNPAYRSVVWSGIERENADGVLDVVVKDVTGQDLDKLQEQQGLPDELTTKGWPPAQR